MNFGELKNDVNFVSRMQAFDESLAAIRDQLERGLAKDTSQMTKEDKIKHDLFIIYSLNTLYLLYAKINGADVQKVSLEGVVGLCVRLNTRTITTIIVFPIYSIPSKMNCPEFGWQWCARSSTRREIRSGRS